MEMDVEMEEEGKFNKVAEMLQRMFPFLLLEEVEQKLAKDPFLTAVAFRLYELCKREERERTALLEIVKIGVNAIPQEDLD